MQYKALKEFVCGGRTFVKGEFFSSHEVRSGAISGMFRSGMIESPTTLPRPEKSEKPAASPGKFAAKK